MSNKRGISNIIATLLLVLLTIVILGILWLVIRNITSSASEGISLSGLTLDLKIQRASIGQNNLSVLVQRQQGAGDLVGIKFVLYDGKVYESVSQNTTLDIYQGKEFVLMVNEIDISAIRTVSVVPIYLSNSGAEKIGRITDTYTFSGGATVPTGGTGGLNCNPAANPAFVA